MKSKKLLSLVLAILLCVGMLPMSVFATDYYEIGDFKYFLGTIDGGVTRAIIVGLSTEGEAKNLTEITTIPEDVDVGHGYDPIWTVSAIYNAAFENNTLIETLTVPANILQIGTVAFSECTNLSEVTLNEGVKRIDGNVFNGCSSLSEITIPKSVTQLSTNTFDGYDGKIKVYYNSYAHTFCKNNNIANFEVIDPPFVQVGQVELADGEYIKNDSTEIHTDEPTGTGYAYFKDGVLTLNSFTYAGKGAPENDVIYAAEALEINVVGTNTINATDGSAMSFCSGYVIDGNGILNLTGSPVCIIGNPQYPAQIKNITLNAVAQIQVLYSGKFSIENATLNLTSKDVSNGVLGSTIAIKNSEIISNSGIDATLGDLEVENSKIVVSDDFALTVNAGHTVKLIYGNITISGNGGDEGAIYVKNSTLALPEVDYWWRTDADGEFKDSDFVYDNQTYIELTTTEPHTHNYTYSANGAVITESCTCGHNETAEIAKDFDVTAIYSGKAYGAKVVYSDNWAGNKVTELKYYKEQKSDGNLVTKCIDAGGYFAVLTVEGITAELMFTIDQKEIGIDWSAPTNLVYDGNAKVPTALATGLVNNDSVNITVALTDGNDNENVGSFTYTAIAIDNINYKLPTNVTSDSYTITQATPTITTPPTASRITSGSKLENSDLTDGVASVDGTFDWETPTKEMTTIGDITEKVIFTPTDNRNYTDVKFDVTVNVYKPKSASLGVARYTVKFDTDEGSTIKSVTVARNNKVPEPAEPTNDGLVFDGWYTDKDLTEKYDFDTKVTKSFTLYAKWSERIVEPDPNIEKPGAGDEDDIGKRWNPFIDVNENDWFHNVVKEAYLSGLIKGTSENTFSPNGNITRGMFVTILYRAEGEPAANYSIPFADVKENDYYANAIIWAQQNEIVKGISETEFAPNANITREQMATILYRYAQFKEYDVSVGEDTNILSYADFDKISEYAIPAMQWACGEKVISGKGDGILDAKGTATRAEAAAVLVRFLEKI